MPRVVALRLLGRILLEPFAESSDPAFGNEDRRELDLLSENLPSGHRSDLWMVRAHLGLQRRQREFKPRSRFELNVNSLNRPLDSIGNLLRPSRLGGIRRSRQLIDEISAVLYPV